MNQATAIGIVIGIIVMCAIVAPIVMFIGATHYRQFKRMKNRTETRGTVVKKQIVTARAARNGALANSAADHYQITYTFHDLGGNQVEKRFDVARFPHQEGDRIVVFYDAENPNDCVTDYQVKTSRESPQKTVIVLLTIMMMGAALFLTLASIEVS